MRTSLFVQNQTFHAIPIDEKQLITPKRFFNQSRPIEFQNSNQKELLNYQALLKLQNG